MPGTIFASLKDAQDSIKENKWTYTQYVKNEKKGEKTWMPVTNPDLSSDLEDFAKIVTFLCNRDQFTAILSDVSRMIWKRYCSYDGNIRNKFTRAMGEVATKLGFTFQNRLVNTTSCPVGIRLVGGDPQLGYMLRNKLFWKDSMDIRHGEHSHSLQWLTIAHGLAARANSQLSTKKKPADLFALTADYRCKPKDSLEYSVTMWQWLADCFPYDMKKYGGQPLNNGETLLSDSFRSPQYIMDYLLISNGLQPIDDHFVSHYLFYRYNNRRWLTIKSSNPDAYSFDGVPVKAADGSWEQSGNADPRVAAARQLRKKDVATYHNGQPMMTVPAEFHGLKGEMTFYKHA